jgi:tryptophanyl-tRNA synthetase
MKKRILTGDRTTGKLHLGHYVGSLKNRVYFQDTYDSFIILADIQALTTHFEDPKKINQGIMDVAIDNLSVGLNPEKITLFQQSQVKSIAELTIFYSMFVSVNSLRHNPTIKTEAKQYGYKDLSYGFLGYPVSQAADITFCNADLIPVGDDQLPHIEQTRKIVRRFNELYGKGKDILTVPEALLSEISRLPGIDGNVKMGKSLGNAIYLSDNKEIIDKKVRMAKTDTNRIHLNDKGNPQVCTVATYHKAFNLSDYGNLCEMCKNATIGCSACKKELADALNKELEPFRDRRAYYEERPKIVGEIIAEGSRKANIIGDNMVLHVKDAMHLLI